jgi:hypothetical protein
MSNRAILFPLRPHVDDVRTDAHVIPDDLPCKPGGSHVSTNMKRRRQCQGESEYSPTGRRALETMRSLGCLTHSVTSALIRREAVDLNDTLLAVQEQRLGGQPQKRSRCESEPTKREDVRILTPSPREHPIQGNSKSADKQFEAAGHDTEFDVNDLWRRVNRNKRVAMMLRDFEVLHRLLLSEIKEMVQEDEECS